jgi:hypothetical protein
MVNHYFKYRHPLHPYLHEQSFRQHYERLWIGQDITDDDPTESSLARLGLVNMVFTFGNIDESHGSAIILHCRAMYFKRAQKLVFSTLLRGATIDMVQALLLMGHYLHNVLELNNCWTVLGLAIRMAQGLGLHLSAETQGFDLIEQEVRKRTWWGCFVLDRLLSAKVGRQPTIDEANTSVELPLAVSDFSLRRDSTRTSLATQSPNAPSTLDFFRYAIAQARLVGHIVESMYGGSRNQGSRATPKDRALLMVPELLAKSIQLDGELASWQSGLPPHLQFDFATERGIYERGSSVLLMR